MTKLNDARIFELITQKLLGTIDAAADQLLQDAIAHDLQVKRCWEELYEANLATGNTLLEYLEPDHAWLQMDLAAAPPPPQQVHKTKLHKLKGWAAALLFSPSLEKVNR